MVARPKAALMTGAMLLAMAGSTASAQTGADDPEITIAMPFDLAPIITSVMAIAVLVLILVAGPKISLQFGKTALRSIGNIFKG